MFQDDSEGNLYIYVIYIHQMYIHTSYLKTRSIKTTISTFDSLK